MKLYTEEQVKQIFNTIYSHSGYYYDMETYCDSLIPIELPSDEEIQKYIDSTPYYGLCTYEFKEGIEDGIKWMKEQILNQNQ